MACITVIAEELEVSYEVDVTKDMLVRDLITELEALMGLPIGSQRLGFRGFQGYEKFEDDKTLGSYDIEKIQGPCLLDSISARQVFFKTTRGRTVTLSTPLAAPVYSLKHRLEVVEGVTADRLRLIFHGKQLEDDRSLSEYDVQKESTIHITHRLRGGGKGPRDSDLAFAGVCREWDGSMCCDEVTGLGLSYNQVVIIDKMIDGHWFYGRLPGEKKGGVFPSSFVEILQYTDEDFMLAHRGSAPFSKANNNTQHKWWTSWWNPERKLGTPPGFSEEVSHASQLKKRLTSKPDLALPPFRYPSIRKPYFKFPLPKSSFIYLSVQSESASPPGAPVDIGVSLSSHAHDSIFVSSIHLTIEAEGSVVLDVRPVSGTKYGKHIELDIQNTSSTENTRQLSGKVGVAQMATGDVGVTREWKTGNSLQLGGKETIPAQISGQVVGKSAFWNIQSEITPSRLRGFSGPVWDGMSFVLDRYSTLLAYSFTVNCRIQGEPKDRIIKGKWWRKL